MDHIFSVYHAISPSQHCHKKTKLSQCLSHHILHEIICPLLYITNDFKKTGNFVITYKNTHLAANSHNCKSGLAFFLSGSFLCRNNSIVEMSAPSARYFLTYCSWQCLAFYTWLPSSSLYCWSPSLLALTWPLGTSGQQSWKHLFQGIILSTDTKQEWRLKVLSLKSLRVTMFRNFSILCFSWSALNINLISPDTNNKD